MLQGPRRILVIAASLTAIPFMTPIATSAAAPAVVARPSVDQPPLAKRGDRSPTVKKMQQLLVKAGITVSGGADGVFGAGTELAVTEYQSRRGLTANGMLDVPTATVLRMLEPTPILNRGSRGDAVREVQQQLITVGLTLVGGADGVYGSSTIATLRQFQRSKDLIVTGAVDAGTASILSNAAAALTPVTTIPTTTAPPPTTTPTTAPPTTTAPPPTTTPPTTPPTTTTPPPPNVVLLSIGSRGDAVKAMQRQLIAVGISVYGGADGVFGSATQTALKQFQSRVGLPANGVFDTVTKAALLKALPPPPPGTVVLAAFPVAPTCSFSDTFGAARSGGRKHEGVDIIVASGTPIYAVMDGRINKKQVDSVGSLGGNALWLTAADGTYFYYAHMSAFAPGIAVGSVVTAGMLIGYVGSTGNAGVPHLHFEVHPQGGAAVNPYPIVKAASGC
ncbi:hypothetical protein BH10ACT2_BH10ACT2_11290 [soil metagenome]